MRKTMMRLAGVAGLSAMCLMGSQALARTGKEARSAAIWVKAGITIEPDGSISALKWENSPKPALVTVLAALEPSVRRLEFEPGRIDGVAAETETTLTLKVIVLERADKGWDIRIANASTGAAAVDMTPPTYPSSQLRSGVEAEVVNAIEIDAEGRLTVLDTTYTGTGRRGSSRKDFMEASAAAVNGWKYRVERVGGHPIAARMSIPIQFCIAPSRSPWCDKSRDDSRSVNGREGPAGEALALDSAVKLKTDLSTLEI